MKGFKSNIEKDTLKNENFRKVLYTSKHLQLVLMTLKKGEEIGEEVHDRVIGLFEAVACETQADPAAGINASTVAQVQAKQ